MCDGSTETILHDQSFNVVFNRDIALQQTIHIKNCGDSAFVNFSAECDSDKLRQMIDMITYLSEELSRFDVSMEHHPEILYYVITS